MIVIGRPGRAGGEGRAAIDQRGGARAWKGRVSRVGATATSASATGEPAAANSRTNACAWPPCAPASGANEAHSKHSWTCCAGALDASDFDAKCLSTCKPAADCPSTRASSARKAISGRRVVRRRTTSVPGASYSSQSMGSHESTFTIPRCSTPVCGSRPSTCSGPPAASTHSRRPSRSSRAS